MHLYLFLSRNCHLHSLMSALYFLSPQGSHSSIIYSVSSVFNRTIGPPFQFLSAHLLYIIFLWYPHLTIKFFYLSHACSPRPSPQICFAFMFSVLVYNWASVYIWSSPTQWPTQWNNQALLIQLATISYLLSPYPLFLSASGTCLIWNFIKSGWNTVTLKLNSS